MPLSENAQNFIQSTEHTDSTARAIERYTKNQFITVFDELSKSEEISPDNFSYLSYRFLRTLLLNQTIVSKDKKDDLYYLRTLLRLGADIEVREHDSDPLLICAVRSNNYKHLTLLLDSDARTEARDTTNMTALMHAANRGSYRCIKALLEKKADINAIDDNRRTALMYAIRGGYEQCLDILLKAEGNINPQDYHGHNLFELLPQRRHWRKSLITIIPGFEESSNPTGCWKILEATSSSSRKRPHSPSIFEKSLSKYLESDDLSPTYGPQHT